MSNTNETRVETIGNTSIAFEKISNQWMVSSLEIHRIFKAGMSTKHGTMIRDFQNRKGCEGDWEECLAGSKITTSVYKDASGKSNSYFYFNRDAFLFYVMTMSTPKSSEFRWAIINRYNELENMVARVARGEENLSIEASELINNMVTSDDVISMGEFATTLQRSRSSCNVSRTKLYQLLRDMGYVTQKENRNTQLGSTYLTTIRDSEHLTLSVKVDDDTIPMLVRRIETFLESNPDNIANKYFGEVGNYDLREILNMEVVDGNIHIGDNAEEKWMDAIGHGSEYRSVKRRQKKFRSLMGEEVDIFAKEEGLEDFNLIYHNEPIPKDSTPIMEDGNCIGWTKVVSGGTLTWSD